jgi:hypothetical protein
MEEESGITTGSIRVLSGSIKVFCPTGFCCPDNIIRDTQRKQV